MTTKTVNNLPELNFFIKEEIKHIYKLYVPAISAAGHAGSLELGLYAYQLLELQKPKKIVDLGSGFTSAVFRLYKKYNPEVEVWSIDDDAKWLEKTKAFLVSQHLDTSNLGVWNEFKTTVDTFDVVLYDLGRIPTRIDNVDRPFSLVTADGILILDDAHFDKAFSDKLKIPPPYLGDVISEAITRHNVASYTALKETTDQFGRYAKVVWVDASK